jgi:hypothetical protein
MSFGHYSVEFLVGRVMSAVDSGIIRYQNLTNDNIKDFVTMYFNSINKLTDTTIAELLRHLDGLNQAAQNTKAAKRYEKH